MITDLVNTLLTHGFLRDISQDLPQQTQEVQMIQAERFLSPGSAQGTTPTAEVKEWTWTTDLHIGQACLVPALLAYPVLSGHSALGDAWLGVRAGMSWAEAISRALLNVCQYLTIIQIENVEQPYPQVDLATISLEPEGARQRYILEQIYECCSSQP